MPSIQDIVDRSGAIEKKYLKYIKDDALDDEPKAVKGNARDFDDELLDANRRADTIAEMAEGVPAIKDRAQVALINAEIRKKKQAALEELGVVRAVMKKGKVSKDEQFAREQQVNDLEDRICSIPDGLNLARKKPTAGAPQQRTFFKKGKYHDVRVPDMGGPSNGEGYYDRTDQNQAFRDEFDERRQAQDEQLDEIEQGLGNLQNIARDMGAEMNKQDVLVDVLEENLDKANKSVETNNQKLAGILKKVRGTRNFCFDIILICIILAIAGYLYSVLS